MRLCTSHEAPLRIQNTEDRGDESSQPHTKGIGRCPPHHPTERILKPRLGRSPNKVLAPSSEHEFLLILPGI